MHRAVGRRGGGKTLRVICLKRNCLYKIIELLILEPITSKTVHVLVKWFNASNVWSNLANEFFFGYTFFIPRGL